MRKTEDLNGLGGGPSCPSLGQDNAALSGPALHRNKGVSASNIPTSETGFSLPVASVRSTGGLCA